MKELQFHLTIKAPKQKVWDTLWQDATFRQWAGVIDPGTHLVGELGEGNEVQFISANGYGVTSLVEAWVPGEFALLRHSADTQDNGAQTRDKQWTGGKESYALAEENGATVLTAVFDVPLELESILGESYPKALQRVKELAEQRD